MQKRRLFIAIPLAASTARSVKKISADLEKKFKDFFSRDGSALRGVGWQIRFAPPENWHLTVTFLGEQDDVLLPIVVDAVKIASRDFKSPEIVFEKISYGPPALKLQRASPLSPQRSGETGPRKLSSEKSGRARMIWLCADRASSERIAKIKEVVDAALASRGVPFQREMRLFSGHITLARFMGETELASLPQIERPLQLSFSATSLDLMESELKRSGAEYGLLQSFPFRE